jgi:hypothetical protein
MSEDHFRFRGARMMNRAMLLPWAPIPLRLIARRPT